MHLEHLEPRRMRAAGTFAARIGFAAAAFNPQATRVGHFSIKQQLNDSNDPDARL
jgi:hypothetical protein